MICPHCFDWATPFPRSEFRWICGVTAEPCHDSTCPAYFGDWGAWRGTVMQHVAAYEFYTLLDLPYTGSLRTDYDTAIDICRTCDYNIDLRGVSYCGKPGYYMTLPGWTRGVSHCLAFVEQGRGWSP